jgi:hypothetical protein
VGVAIHSCPRHTGAQAAHQAVRQAPGFPEAAYVRPSPIRSLLCLQISGSKFVVGAQPFFRDSPTRKSGLTVRRGPHWPGRNANAAGRMRGRPRPQPLDIPAGSKPATFKL